MKSEIEEHHPMTNRIVTDPADVAELLRWARESRSRPAMAETTAACVRRLEARNTELEAENARLREALNRLTTDITMTPAALDSISLAVFEDACAVLAEGDR
jgi:hypothetical protein